MRAGTSRVTRRQAEAGEKLFINPRNSAAGAVRQLDPKATAKRNLAMWSYSAAGMEVGSQKELLETLQKFGLRVNPLAAAQALAIVLVPIYARQLGVANYGVLAIVNTTLSLGLMVTAGRIGGIHAVAASFNSDTMFPARS